MGVRQSKHRGNCGEKRGVRWALLSPPNCQLFALIYQRFFNYLPSFFSSSNTFIFAQYFLQNLLVNLLKIDHFQVFFYFIIFFLITLLLKVSSFHLEGYYYSILIQVQRDNIILIQVLFIQVQRRYANYILTNIICSFFCGNICTVFVQRLYNECRLTPYFHNSLTLIIWKPPNIGGILVLFFLFIFCEKKYRVFGIEEYY